MSKFPFLFLILPVLLGFFGPQANAQTLQWAASDHVRAALLTDRKAGEDRAALALQIAPEWHAYWRVPGDAGLAPRFDWAGSDGTQIEDIFWPVPLRFEEAGLVTFGYEGDVSFPLRLKFSGEPQNAKLMLKIDIMVCRDICIPESLNLSAGFGGEADAFNTQMIDNALKSVPQNQDLPGLKIGTIVTGPEGIVVSVYSRSGFENFEIFASAGDYAFTAAPQITLDESDKTRAMIKIAKHEDIDNLQAFLNGKTLDVVVRAGHDAVEKTAGF